VTSHAQSRRSASVSDDWRAWLPERKEKLFRAHLQDLESSYGMLSVSLDEAIELHNCGRLPKSFQMICVTPDLCGRLVASLVAVLHTMGEHAKHYGTVPNAAPLDAANFRGSREQRSAKLNSLVSHVLLTQRSQFLHKIRALEEMVEELLSVFHSAAKELTIGVSANPQRQWQALDSAHFDLNTCLRETIVILKSFFVVLPDDEIQAFEQCVCSLQKQHRRQPSAVIHTLRWDQRKRTAQVIGK
jgi:hypothetical protein